MNTTSEIETVELSDQIFVNNCLARIFEMKQRPKCIYLKGNSKLLDTTHVFVTIVGTRKPTQYAGDCIDMIISTLANTDTVVISGLALGVDTLVHEACLKYKVKTIGVPGSGLDDSVIYPRSSYNLANRILENDGLLVSPFDRYHKAAKYTFPARNAIMAAMSSHTILIEAQIASGSMITINHALSLGKEVAAVPGSIFNSLATGPHYLINEGATPLWSKESVLEFLNLDTEVSYKNYSENEKILLSILANPCNKDKLLVQSELDYSTFISTFTNLELAGCIQESFGEVRKVV